MTRRIFNYIDADGTDPVGEFMISLEPKLQRKLETTLNNARDPCYLLRPPGFKVIRIQKYKGLYEVRIKMQQMVRVVFYIDQNGSMVLLHGFIKNNGNELNRALETANKRRTSVQNGTAQIKEFLEVCQ